MDNLRFQFLSSDWPRIEKSEFSKEKFNFRSNCYFQYFKTIIYIYINLPTIIYLQSR